MPSQHPYTHTHLHTQQLATFPIHSHHQYFDSLVVPGMYLHTAVGMACEQGYPIAMLSTLTHHTHTHTSHQVTFSAPNLVRKQAGLRQ